jgi:hypothetical protein
MNYFFLFLLFHTLLIGSQNNHLEHPKRRFFLLKGEPLSGLYSNLMRVAEWLYIVKKNENLGMVIDLRNFFGMEENLMDLFFQPINDPQIKFSIDKNPTTLKVRCFPSWPVYVRNGGVFVENRRWVKNYPTDGLSSFEKTKWVFNNADSYLNPQIHIYRKRLNPLIKEYLKPNERLERKINSYIQSLQSPITGSDKKPHVIGIHLRMPDLYYNDKGDKIVWNYNENIYIDEVEKSIDHLIKDRDPDSIKLYISTINQPVIDRLSLKYHVITSNIPRSPKLNSDWQELLDGTDKYQNAEGAIIDAWVLSQCDQFFCGPSNLAMFVTCLNQELKTDLLPCFEGWKSK